ncbi:hypothetical protein Hokovirus_4_23 [Hokovirus HKV1]|uniref:Uncharacterized protein n=1 Tax=Hokovirus HKV1 TaxID=1977638 RepID=A0A1V0SH43_9VIRU|nr:hypothetical protein Hokovirus_4_23 [Hokovirus HKV1]
MTTSDKTIQNGKYVSLSLNDNPWYYDKNIILTDNNDINIYHKKYNSNNYDVYYYILCLIIIIFILCRYYKI